MLYAPVLGVTRPPFLVLTPVCVFLGIAVVIGDGGSIDWLAAGIVLLGALSAHISVNALNEYEDFRSGLDLRTQRTPFSGGSGALVAQPALAEQARAIGLVFLGLTAGCGLVLLWRAGLGLLPIGVLGLTLVFFYTTDINHHRWLCLVAPGLGFGPLMVVGAYYGVTGTWSSSAVLASLIPFFLVSNLLLLNQLPDVEADRSVGRDNLPIALGIRRSLHVYGLFSLLAYVSLGLGVALSLLPPGALIASVTLPLAVVIHGGVGRTVDRGGSLTPDIVPSMALNVVLTLLTPALLAVGMLLHL
ncbi:MAG: prenyltransferase [Chromatiaceae bacterium]|nr:prenyltransferase [Chromatiaceae bacterium]